MYQKECEAMISACKRASEEILKIYQKDFHIEIKPDHSPVTEADLASNRIIKKELSQFKDVGWLSEEDADDLSRLEKRALFIVDPLDGTQDFVNRDDSFGINIALVIDNKPVVSVVGVPAKKSYAYAIKDEGCFYVENNQTSKLHVSDRTQSIILVQSMTHVLDREKAIENKYKERIKKVVHLGASTKMIALAKGDVDCSVRYTDKTKEWDVCAPELLVTEAGGIFLDTDLKPFSYNRKNVYNTKGYCMLNRIENAFLLTNKPDLSKTSFLFRMSLC